jgi:Flp pilus assembly protein TadD
MGIGNCLLQKGDTKWAMAAFQEALRYQPDIWQAHRELGKLLAQEGRDTEAVVHLQQAVHLAPTNEQAKQLLQEVQARLRSGANPSGTQH